MTNNVGFTFSVGDTTPRLTSRIGDTKCHIWCSYMIHYQVKLFLCSTTTVKTNTIEPLSLGVASVEAQGLPT